MGQAACNKSDSIELPSRRDSVRPLLNRYPPCRISVILVKMGTFQLSTGSLFANRFEIDRPAGSGGMGTVYRAIDRYSGDTVALKLLHSGGGSYEGDRFAREAQILSELRHPGIVAHIAHGRTPDGQRFLAMEWLEGQDLGQRLMRGPLLVDDCLRLLAQVAEALSVAHERGIIHRDIKPTNLFLVQGDVGRVKILDFGIARRIASSQAMTRTGTVIGTPEYMAPEQARGSRDITLAADLFSLGCVLYECLTGQPPFVAEHIAAVLVRILFEEPVPIEVRRPGISESLASLLRQLLAKEPAARMADASALRAALINLGKQSEPALALTLDNTDPIAVAFAESEYSLLSVVLAAPEEEDIEPSGMQQGRGVPRGPADRRALLEALSAIGGTPDFLANGTLVVTVPPLGSAQDQAVVAARAARLIKGRWADAVVSMSTGRGAIRGKTAVGEVVELAARFLKWDSRPVSKVSAAGILIDNLSAKLLEGRFAQTPQPDGTLLLGEEREVDDSRTLLGKPTPCVGREAELGMLQSQLDSCIEESHARAILVTAPPGVGKSRLRHEFLRRVERRSEKVTTLLGRGELLQAGAGYASLAKAIRGLCGISERDPVATNRQRLRERIEQHLPAGDIASVLPFVGEICGVPFPEPEHPLLQEALRTPKLLQSRLRRACLSWLAAECHAAPVLIVLDDFHWGDELTIALVHEALRELQDAPLFILVLCRPEIHKIFPELGKGHRLQEIELKGLSKRACERLVQQALGKQISAGSIEWIVEQSAGNALFLEEMIRAAADGQLNKCPDTVMAMLQARIGHLAAGPRRAVLAASLFGQTLWQGGVARVLGCSEHGPELEEWLRTLIDAELIEGHNRSRIAKDREYGFRHALMHEAAHLLLTDEDRRIGHQRVAQYLQEMGQSDPLVLAEHYRSGSDPQRAISQYLRAADAANRLGALNAARQHCASALSLLSALPEDVENRRLRIDVLLRQVQFGMLADATDHQISRLTEAEALLRGLTPEGEQSSGDRRRCALVELLRGRVYYYRGQQLAAIESCRQVLPIAEALADEELLAFPSQMLGAVLLAQGQAEKCRPLLARAVSLMERLDSEHDRLRTMGYYAINLVIRGQYRDGMALHDQALARAAESKQPAALALAHTMRSSSLRLCGDYPGLLSAAQSSYELAEQCGDNFCAYMALSLLAVAHSVRGQPLQASEYRGRAQTLTRLFGARMLSDWFAAGDAEMALRAGDIDQTLAIVTALAPEFRREGRLLALGLAEQVWGLALGFRARAQGPHSVEFAAAEAHLAEGLALMESTEQRMNAAILRLEWAELARMHQALERARELREQALAQFETSGCPHLVIEVERAAALRSPLVR